MTGATPHKCKPATRPTSSRFVFRGSAIPIGGRVLRVRDDRTPYNLQSPPASALSVAGGHCDASSPGSVFRDIFSWGPTCRSKPGRSKAGRVTRYHRNLVDQECARSQSAPSNVFTVDQLKLTLVSTHPKQGQPSIVPTQVMFCGDQGMFLNNQKITLSTDLDDFCRMSTLEQFDCEFKTKQVCLAEIPWPLPHQRVRAARISSAHSQGVQRLCGLLVRERHKMGEQDNPRQRP